MQLEGKTALVTGSGRNIGRSIALALAREGADVVVNARSNQADVESVAAEVKELGRNLAAAAGRRGRTPGPGATPGYGAGRVRAPWT